MTLDFQVFQVLTDPLDLKETEDKMVWMVSPDKRESLVELISEDPREIRARVVSLGCRDNLVSPDWMDYRDRLV